MRGAGPDGAARRLRAPALTARSPDLCGVSVCLVRPARLYTRCCPRSITRPRSCGPLAASTGLARCLGAGACWKAATWAIHAWALTRQADALLLASSIPGRHRRAPAVRTAIVWLVVLAPPHHTAVGPASLVSVLDGHAVLTGHPCGPYLPDASRTTLSPAQWAVVAPASPVRRGTRGRFLWFTPRRHSLRQRNADLTWRSATSACSRVAGRHSRCVVQLRPDGARRGVAAQTGRERAPCCAPRRRHRPTVGASASAAACRPSSRQVTPTATLPIGDTSDSRRVGVGHLGTGEALRPGNAALRTLPRARAALGLRTDSAASAVARALDEPWDGWIPTRTLADRGAETSSDRGAALCVVPPPRGPSASAQVPGPDLYAPVLLSAHESRPWRRTVGALCE